MCDQDLFEMVLNRFVEKYHITLERPYNDGYMIFKLRNGEVLGEFNSDGYNLLRNLRKLCEVFSTELR